MLRCEGKPVQVRLNVAIFEAMRQPPSKNMPLHCEYEAGAEGSKELMVQAKTSSAKSSSLLDSRSRISLPLSRNETGQWVVKKIEDLPVTVYGEIEEMREKRKRKENKDILGLRKL